MTGVVTLVKQEGRINPIWDGYRAHCQIDYSEMQHSYQLNLINQEKLAPGESCEATVTFLFGTIAELKLNLSDNSELQLNEGGRNIGTFYVKNIHIR